MMNTTKSMAPNIGVIGRMTSVILVLPMAQLISVHNI